MMLGKIKNEQIVDKIKENKFLLVETHSFVDKETSIKHIKETYLNAERRLMLTYYKTEKDNKTQPVSISCFGNSFVRQKHDKGAGLIVSLCGSDDLTKKNVLHFFESVINSSNEEGKPWLELAHHFGITDLYDNELLKYLTDEQISKIKNTIFWRNMFVESNYDYLLDEVLPYERLIEPLFDYRIDEYLKIFASNGVAGNEWNIYDRFYKNCDKKTPKVASYFCLDNIREYFSELTGVKEESRIEYENLKIISSNLSQKNKDKLEEREM